MKFLDAVGASLDGNHHDGAEKSEARASNAVLHVALPAAFELS
ncbi:MAG TPA: hypothetical protein VHC39_14375 [Rhizomicrobium sp.]|nr:hypothetical protein [Rhizomicrobium sp.]